MEKPLKTMHYGQVFRQVLLLPDSNPFLNKAVVIGLLNKYTVVQIKSEATNQWQPVNTLSPDGVNGYYGYSSK
jgi:hypothetical protein